MIEISINQLQHLYLPFLLTPNSLKLYLFSKIEAFLLLEGDCVLPSSFYGCTNSLKSELVVNFLYI